INTKAQKKSVMKIISFCCCSFLLILFTYFILWQAYSVIVFSAPKELREMNTVALARHFAYMDNPYSVSTLTRNTPVVTSIYGLLVPLLMSPFIRLFSFTSLSTLQICELLTLIVELIGTFCFYKVIIRKTKNHLAALIGALLFHTCYWRYSVFGGTFPDQWGLTLSILLLDLLYTDEQKKHYRPLLYAGCMVALFYIKQYFVLLVIGLCIYLFVLSKKDLLKLIAYGILMGGLSVIVVYFLFPLYFSEVFPIAHGQTITGDPAYSLMQVIRLSLYYAPVALPAFIGIVQNLYDMIRHKRSRDKFTYDFCQIIFIFVPLFYIAENQGTNYTYYLQLWYPYLILYGVIFAANSLERLLQKCNNPICFHHPRTLLPLIGSIAICMSAVLALIKVIPSYRSEPMTQKQQEAWNHAYNMLDQYSADGEILVSMLLSDYCIEHDIPTSNYGQAEYNNRSNLENYKNNKLWRNIFLFDYTEDLLQQNISYNQSVRDKVYARSYRCIALVYTGEYHLTDDDLINAGYQATASEELTAGAQCWHIVFYTLID
ncbi:MAG: glycosyltransferase family 39 protein, partial [Eubacterium sp.]|nr:glycosyltransferase family 39 protein [Eubacterium sp.]